MPRNFVAKHAKRCGAGSHTARKYSMSSRRSSIRIVSGLFAARLTRVASFTTSTTARTISEQSASTLSPAPSKVADKLSGASSAYTFHVKLRVAEK